MDDLRDLKSMSDNINAIVYSDQDKFDQAENNVREADANIESGVTEIALVRLSVLQFPRHLLYPRHETNNRLLLLFRCSCDLCRPPNTKHRIARRFALLSSL